MFLPRFIAFSSLVIVLVAGCGPSKPKVTPPDETTTPNKRSEQPLKADSQSERKVVEKKTDNRPPFDDNEMIRPLNEIRGYAIEDYRILPNCLTLFKECVAVPYEGKTTEQYKDALQVVAQKPCRMVLKLVDVWANYDGAEFEMRTDEGESALDILKDGEGPKSYAMYLKFPFPISNVKKSKGLDSKRLTIGAHVNLVGLGYIVPASPWGAARPYKGMPRGDERYVMLRAFGKTSANGSSDYQFSFMIRNWYIASQ